MAIETKETFFKVRKYHTTCAAVQMNMQGGRTTIFKAKKPLKIKVKFCLNHPVGFFFQSTKTFLFLSTFLILLQYCRQGAQVYKSNN